MSYEYTDPKRANEDYALPDVEVFEDTIIEVDMECCGSFEVYLEQIENLETDTDEPINVTCISCERDSACQAKDTGKTGYWYAYGFPGCLWNSDPIGPFETYEEALEDARENAGVYDEDQKSYSQGKRFCGSVLRKRVTM